MNEFIDNNKEYTRFNIIRDPNIIAPTYEANLINLIEENNETDLLFDGIIEYCFFIVKLFLYYWLALLTSIILLLSFIFSLKLTLAIMFFLFKLL